MADSPPFQGVLAFPNLTGLLLILYLEYLFTQLFAVPKFSSNLTTFAEHSLIPAHSPILASKLAAMFSSLMYVHL